MKKRHQNLGQISCFKTDSAFHLMYYCVYHLPLISHCLIEWSIFIQVLSARFSFQKMRQYEMKWQKEEEEKCWKCCPSRLCITGKKWLHHSWTENEERMGNNKKLTIDWMDAFCIPDVVDDDYNEWLIIVSYQNEKDREAEAAAKVKRKKRNKIW